MKKVLVRSSYNLVVDVPDEWNEFEIQNYIEEKECPNSGNVGHAMREMLRKSDETSLCWCGKANAENKVLDYNYKGNN